MGREEPLIYVVDDDEGVRDSAAKPRPGYSTLPEINNLCQSRFISFKSR